MDALTKLVQESGFAAFVEEQFRGLATYGRAEAGT